MKKQKFLFTTRFSINAILFQCKLCLNQENVNKYLHLTLMKKIEHVKLENAAKSGSLDCLKYAFNVIQATDNDFTLMYAISSKNISCIEYCKKKHLN